MSGKIPSFDDSLLTHVHDSYTWPCGYNGCTQQGCVPCQGLCMSCYKIIQRKSKPKTEMKCTQCQKSFDSYDGVLICDDCCANPGLE